MKRKGSSEYAIQTSILKKIRKKGGIWLKMRESLAGVSAISDIIGCYPVEITPDMVGKKIGVYVAIEVKKPGDKPRPDQMEFLRLIKVCGGLSGWADCLEDAMQIIENERRW